MNDKITRMSYDDQVKKKRAKRLEPSTLSLEG